MKVKKIFSYLLISMLGLSLYSCTDDNDSNSVVTVDKGILENYSYFEVDVSAAPITVSQIAQKSWYTKPNSNYGLTSYITFEVNDDNTIDILWLESNSTKHLSRISLENQSLVENIPINDKVNPTGKILGFEKLDYDKFVIGYTKDNSFGDEDNEAWYTAFNKSSEIFSTRIFGEENNEEVGAKGEPGAAGSAVIRYNPEADVLNIYLAHKQMYSDGVRHQGGWVGFIDCQNGEVITESNGSHIGSGWYYSHNFDQRSILSSDGYFYLLAHGDAYPRALGISKIGHINGFESKFKYYELLDGETGDNFTNSHTGDLVELSNDNIAIAFSTGETRVQRDLRVAIVGGMKSDTTGLGPRLIDGSWVTLNQTEYVGWGAKIAQYGEYILVAWNQYNSSNEGTGSYFKLLDFNGDLISDTEHLEETSFYPAQSILTSSDGKNLVWVSAHGDNKLRVNLLEIP